MCCVHAKQTNKQKPIKKKGGLKKVGIRIFMEGPVAVNAQSTGMWGRGTLKESRAQV